MKDHENKIETESTDPVDSGQPSAAASLFALAGVSVGCSFLSGRFNLVFRHPWPSPPPTAWPEEADPPPHPIPREFLIGFAHLKHQNRRRACCVASEDAFFSETCSEPALFVINDRWF
jgi:hypothetical protein